MVSFKTFLIPVLFFLLVPLVNGYCNETTIYSYKNFTELDNTTRLTNTTITKQCTEEYNNFSLYGILITFLFLITLSVYALVKSEKIVFKTVSTLVISLLLMTVLRFLSWFVTITNPLQTGLINVLDHFYMFTVWGFRLTLLASAFILLIITLNALKDHKKKRRNNWENWGNE